MNVRLIDDGASGGLPADLASLDTPQPGLIGPADDTGARPGTASRRLMVVEDDKPIREALGQLLRDEGFETDLCDNGARALERLRTTAAPDLIILDLRMPVMDGWEFRATQRSDPALASIPVLAISADGSAQAKAVHAAAYLRKPLRAEELLSTVRRILRESERRQMADRLVEAERLAALGRLAAGVGHEINNPLTYVALNVKLIAERVQAVGPDEVSERLQLQGIGDMLGDALDGLERVRQIVENLQSLSRRTESVLSPVSLEALLDRTLAMADHQLRPRARVIKSYGGVPPLLANAGTLGQLFLNLLTNAAQAIDEGHAAENEVSVTTRSEGGRVVVEISDTGPGIREEILPRIFDPFFTTKPLGKGTGLGLAICKQIVIEHGGDIGIRSRPGQGTTVWVRFPRRGSRPDPTPLAPPSPPLGAAPRRRRLLVVDDEPLIGRIIARALEPDHEVVLADSSTEALEHIARDDAFDLVLCDLIMPRGGGSEMRAGLVARAPHLLDRLVFMTGGAFTPQAQLLVEQSHHPLLEKPFTMDDIRRLVSRTLAPSRGDA
jgi:signal transduction histidine kinase